MLPRHGHAKELNNQKGEVTMKAYKPKCTNKRWLDEDCPKGVLDIFGHPKFYDRYTVLYSEVYGGDGLHG